MKRPVHPVDNAAYVPAPAHKAPDASGAKKSDRTRERIVAAALEVFLEKGFAETTIQDCAERAGVGKGTVYYYVASKEELLTLVVDGAMGDFLAVMRSDLAGMDDPLERLRHLVSAHVATMSKGAPLWEAFHARPEAACPGLSARLAPHRGEYIEMLAGLIEEGRERGVIVADDPQVTARLVAGTVMGAFFQWSKFDSATRPAPNPTAICDFVMRALANGGPR